MLSALEMAFFEPLSSIVMLHLTYETVMLVAVTSARRVSELCALSTNPNLCIFHSDRVVLRLDPAFIPLINTWFHSTQDIVLPPFCPKPTCQLEADWHKLDVRRVLKHYIDRTKQFRKTDSLFIMFRGKSTGLHPSRTTGQMDDWGYSYGVSILRENSSCRYYCTFI